MNITSEFFGFNVWEWFLYSSVLEWTESDLSKFNWLHGIILLHSNSVGALRAGFYSVTFLLDLFRLSGIKSQSWFWVVWPREHEVHIKWWHACILTWLEIYASLPGWKYRPLFSLPSLMDKVCNSWNEFFWSFDSLAYSSFNQCG